MIVDASVALKWFLNEPLSNEAQKLIMPQDLKAPDLLVTEVLNGLRKAVRDQRLPVDLAKEAMRKLDLAVPTIAPVSLFADLAIDMSLALNHPIYDCIYLAMADEMDATLVTADAAFVNLVAPSKWAGRVVMLGAP